MTDYTDQTEMINTLHEDVSEALALVRERETRINELIARNVELLAERDEWETIAKNKAKIIEKMESEQREIMRELPTWISVEERLPEALETVLVTDGKGVGFSFTVEDYGTLDFYSPWRVTHWMPLPNAPQSTEGDTK